MKFMVQIHYRVQDEIQYCFNNSSGAVSIAVQKLFRKRFENLFEDGFRDRF
jgi:hypothetical protein